MRCLAKARVLERFLKRRALCASLIVMVDEVGLLEAEPELDFAELLGLKT